MTIIITGYLYFQCILFIDADVSLMSVACKQAGCTNMCSVFVYPFCYEHIESEISERHHTAAEPHEGD